jgi:hypothetical protein
MIANFFRSLEEHQVEYLLISGQATVLYGAATFSEDIDLWIAPNEANQARFLAVLTGARARHYKLTPPFTVELLKRGHGFHFVLPDGKDGEIYLDVMGHPPRSESFAEAAGTSCPMDTEWGTVRTIGIKPLVELKKTQRLEDYPIISKLALAWFDRPECARSAGDFEWALENIFTLPELAMFLAGHPAGVAAAATLDPATAEYAAQLLAGGEVEESVERRVEELFQARMAALQLADRRYWRDIIRELKQFKVDGKLMPEGAMV